MDVQTLKPILEALIMASAKPISVERMLSCFSEKEVPDSKTIMQALKELGEDYEKSSVELKEVSSGFRFQVRKDYAEWVSKLWEDKPGRYSRALLETLALVAYKQPISRGEIEKIRGVSVSTQIMKTLMEREWVHIVGHRDVPGKPAIYATTKAFLDYFNLKSLDELPPLAEIKDIDRINGELDLPSPDAEEGENITAGSDRTAQTEKENADEQVQDDVTVVNMEIESEVLDEAQNESLTENKDDDNEQQDVDVSNAMTAEN